jgi:hypothetical protein
VKRKKMNTKQIALPLIVVIAVLLAFSSPAAADYSGDHPLTTYEHGFVDGGGLIYETVTDNTTYTVLNTTIVPPLESMTQNIAITIPAGATVKTARLYNYVTWGKSDFGDKYKIGMPAEADLTFNGATVTCQNPLTGVCAGYSPPIACRDALPNPINYSNGAIQYWDTKGPNYTCGIKYDYPSGTFAWDVTDLVTGSGTYVATVANNDSTPTPNEYFATFGFGLLVVYEDCCGQEIEYWIDEGCDVLLNTSKYGVSEPIATTNAPFSGCIGDVGDVVAAELTIVTMAPDKGNWSNWPASMNMNYFNGLTTADEIGPSVIDTSITNSKFRARTIGSSTLAGMWHGYNEYVLPRLQPSNNILYLQDRDLGTGRGDNTAVSNAFLVLEKPPISADVTIEPETLNLNSNGQWVTAYIELPACYDVANINATTVYLNDTIPAVNDTQYGFVTDPDSYLMDHDGDGILERMVKFDRAAVIAYLETIDFESETGSDKMVELAVTGKLFDETAFEGSDTVRVIE